MSSKAIEKASKLDELNKKRRFLTAELESKAIGLIEKIKNNNDNRKFLTQ